MKIPKGGHNTPPTTNLVPVREILKMVRTGVIVPWPFNRAKGEEALDWGKLKDHDENFNLNALSSLTLGSFAGSFTIADAHGRVALMLIRDSEGRATQQELDHEWPVYVVVASRFIQTYQDLNNGKPHTNGVKIMNPALLVGRLMDDLESESQCDALSRASNRLNFMDILLAHQQFSGEFGFKEILSCRDSKKLPFVTTKLLNFALDKRYFDFTPSTKHVALGALESYNKLKVAVENLKKDDPTKVAVNSPGFFMSFMSDYVSDGSTLGGFSKRKPGMLVRTIESKPHQVHKYAMTVTRRNMKVLEDVKLKTLLSK
jgi:hypothetical protein